MFHDKADGSLVEVDGKVVGSSLIGQAFTDAQGNPIAKYFQPRPSAAAAPTVDRRRVRTDAELGSNLGPTNPTCSTAVRDASTPTASNGLARRRRGAGRCGDRVRRPGSTPTSRSRTPAPGPRSHARGRCPSDRSLGLVDEHTDGRALGFLGEKGVNVLELNLALDRLSRSAAS